MPTFDNLDDFLRALEENPQWREAVRALILSQELLRLPVQFMAYSDQMSAFVAEQRQFNEAVGRRLDRIEGDMANLRGAYVRETAIRDAMGIAMDLGFEYVRTMPYGELALMAQRATGSIPTDELRSFRQADLVIEATNGSDTHYIAVETSYTADQRDTSRAQRNARFLTEFTGHVAHAAVASVRNDDRANREIDCGGVYWHPLNDRGSAAPE